MKKMAEEEAPFPAMSPADIEELSEEQQDKQNALKQEGTEALEDGNKELALEKFTAAIEVGCASALLYSRRAQLLLKLGRPKAAANDCTAALTMNPDSGKAFKIRARANAKLEKWEEAHADFSAGLKIDYDEETYDESLEVAKKAKELQAAAVEKRVQEEKEEYQRKLQESKAAYEAGLAANAAKWAEEKEKEEEEKRKKEEERKARVRAREKEEGGADETADEPGVPKSHAPPTPETEDVD